MANPNPIPALENLRPFQPGHSGNPGGKTIDQRKREIENAEKATRIRAALLDKLVAIINAQPEGATVAGMEEFNLTHELLKLIKDSEDRGLGAPTAKVDFNAGISEMTDEQLDAEIRLLPSVR